MKKIIFLLTLLVAIFSCAQEKTPILGESEFQLKINAEYKDATTSPLKKKDRKHFKSLDFFKVDSSFIVKANLTRTPNTEFFGMKTTTERLSKERVYGVVSFELKGAKFELNVYQNEELMGKEEYVDYLFFPFLDDTNGEESYGGGRYIDLRIPDGDTIIIDFNTAYNPYCAYNPKYSCPIVPRDNYLPLKVEAGVKAFDKH